MRKFLKARRRRYGLAIVIVAASLGVLAACNPTKPQPPPNNACGATTGACLTISPLQWPFYIFNET